MKQLLSKKYWWVLVLLVLVAVNWLAALFHFRIDLTAEKRYTLAPATKTLLKNLKEPVSITVFLSGDMPAGFKKLANSSAEMLQEFKETGKGNITYRFEKPAEGLTDSLKIQFIDSLQSMGLSPMNVKAQVKEGEGQEERYVYPGAVIAYKGRITAVDFLQGQSNVDGLNSLNNAEALLEYKLANTIQKITQDSVPLIGYLLGNGQPFSYNVWDLIERSLKKTYSFSFLPIDSVKAIPPFFNALVITKPTQAFTDAQKLKLDQYVMQGGKILWMIDNLYAEMDSLQRSQNEFIAFDRGLNLQDLLFKYGVRINQDLVQSIVSDKIPSVVGNMGGKPQIELLPWPYFPLLTNSSNHPIAKNLDYVVSQFPNSIDTVQAVGIAKTILLNAAEARALNTPAKVSWNSIQTEDDLKTFNKPNIPVAVLLEGSFTSLYNNRLTTAMKDELNSINTPFKAQSSATKMIVIADGDIALNSVSQTDGPLQMGMNPYTKNKYANSEFIANCIEYLVGNSGILETRSKDFTLRLLDKKKLEANKTIWQVIAIAVPLLLVIIFGALYQWLRKRKYSK